MWLLQNRVVTSHAAARRFTFNTAAAEPLPSCAVSICDEKEEKSPIALAQLDEAKELLGVGGTEGNTLQEMLIVLKKYNLIPRSNVPIINLKLVHYVQTHSKLFGNSKST